MLKKNFQTKLVSFKEYVLYFFYVDTDKRIIKCLVPLSEIIGYSKYLRSATKGEGKFIMTFSHFKSLTADKQKEVLLNPFM